MFSKEDVATALEEIGTLLELKGESSFRTNAYHNGARAIRQFEGDFKGLVETGKLSEIRGIGSSLQEKVLTLARTGELAYLNDLRNEIPTALIQMLRIPKLGPKKIKVLHDELGIETLQALQEACEDGRVAKLKGFGAKTADNILQGLAFLDQVGKRVRIDQALPLGLALLEQLRKLPGVQRSELCGSLRRRRETAKDIDILISSDDAAPIMEAFTQLPEVMQVVAHGETKSSIVASMQIDGEKIILNADLRVVPDAAFPFALHYFTGSKEHNVRVRQRAIDQGLSLNEYGLTGKKNVACETEEDIFRALGLDYIPPELREDTGEITAAESHHLPQLVELADLRGVFHNHSTYSDGNATLEQMALAAKERGWEYFGIADHSQSLKVARGLSPEQVRQQWQEIDALNKKLQGIRIIKGIESDILDDGSLDYDDELLQGFEYVVASVHTNFGMSMEEMTKRICTALRHPATTMLGHATGRLLLRREGYKVDLDEVLKVAAEHGKMIEINAHPVRLDLDWTYVKKAKSMGIPLVICPDAHSTQELDVAQFGIHVARRGWLEKQHVFNTLTLQEMLAELHRRKVS
ncbi:MAG: DNA polymerase/3'-5' exonuclease PolX [Zavarzinella sp.]